MPVVLERAVQPLRKLRRLLKHFPGEPTPKDVHSLRTQARRLEAVVAATAEEQDEAGRKLLRAVNPLRKAAGDARDADVLLNKVRLMQLKHGQKSLEKLIERLSEIRLEEIRVLCREVHRGRRRARNQLRDYMSRLESGAWADATVRSERAAAPRMLAAQLRHWPRIDAANLHGFRIHVKELGYMLQLSSQSNPERLAALESVKDAAGDWHDWAELLARAEDTLDARKDAHALNLITGTVERKLHTALAAANALRRDGFRISELRESLE